MAVVRQIIEGPVATRVHPTETDALVQIVRPVYGAALVQISTFGSDARQSEPKVSQTIQLNEEAALALRKLIERAFGAND